MAEQIAGGGSSGCVQEAQPPLAAAENVAAGRKERRKAAKREKRKQKRKELAAKEREEEEALLNDSEEQRRIQMEEERENERLERERKEFEEHERVFLEALAAKKKKAEEEEEERRKALEEESKQNQVGNEDENDNDDWEYVEEGPPEIIWQGNEIIVKKKKVRVKKKDVDQQIKKEDPNRPTSNPLPPQSESFADYKNGSVVSAQQLLENAAQQIPNFGTEQDKAHCPFHLKTGACRFGSRCSRVHFYPDKACTLLIKNMYNGPGLAWEQDEGLEHTDEEVDRCYEEFYEDVHTEFLKFGEIVNFKVCKNGSSHLRGNMYVHYMSLDSAVLAYQSINGRYFAGKLLTCEFVGVTKWKVAICGEYMKSRLKTCSRGTACNFIHCFRNPGGDYEWADWDKQPPKYWVKKMAALFGYSEESGYDYQMEQERRNSSRMMATDPDRKHYRKSRSRERDSSRSRYEEYDARRSRHWERHTSGSRNAIEVIDEKNHGEEMNSKNKLESKNRMHDSDSDGDWSNKDRGGGKARTDRVSTRESSSHRKKVYGNPDDYESKTRTDSGGHLSDEDRERDAYHRQRRKSSRHQNTVPGSPDNRDRTHDSDSREEDRVRHHRHKRKRSRHSNEGLGFIDDHGNSVKKLKDEHNQRESDSEKLETQRVKKSSQSSRWDCSSIEPSESNFSAKVLKSHDMDSRYNSNENIDKMGHPKSRDKFSLKHQKSFRDSSSDESYESNSVRWYSPRGKSHDSGCYSDEDIDERGRWESEKIGPEKHHTSRRKFSGDDFDQDGRTSNCHDLNSDECYRESRSRDGKSSDGLEEGGSAEECQEFREREKKHSRKYRTRGHKKNSS
ncbi:hypothetical protein CsSME_00024995 [Camellia sinensis var. sinensis]